MTKKAHFQLPNKILKMLFALALAVAFMPAAALAPSHAWGAEPHSGTSGSCSWSIDANGKLTVWPTNGESGTLGDPYSPEWSQYKGDITEVEVEKDVHVVTGIGEATFTIDLFSECPKLKHANISGLNMSDVKSITALFNKCTNLETIDLPTPFVTSDVTEIHELFMDCTSLKKLDLSSFDNSGITNQQEVDMFYSNFSFIGWDDDTKSSIDCSPEWLRIGPNFKFMGITLPSNTQWYSHTENRVLTASEVTARDNIADTYEKVIDFSNDVTITPSATQFNYNGKDQKPTYTLTLKSDPSKVLTEGVDYEIVWPETKTPGSKTATFNGLGKYTGSTVTAQYSIANVTPTITTPTGSNPSWTQGSTSSLIIMSSAPKDDFVRLTIKLQGNDAAQLIDQANYTVTEGSTIVEIKPDYLATLPAGQHEIAVESLYGTAKTPLTIAEPTPPSQELPTSVTVTFDVNEGTGTFADITGEPQKPMAGKWPTTEPTREGYTFTGWFSAPIDGFQVTGSDNFPPADVTYYAQWKENTSAGDADKDAVIAPAMDGKWVKQGSKWWYQYSDKTWPSSCNMKIGNATYHFDANGYMTTGWDKASAGWYYYGASGARATGWVKASGKWYYLEPATSLMKTGWFDDADGKKYYLGATDDGAMKTGWVNDNGTWYLMDASGAMRTDWAKVGRKWYYLTPVTGEMKTGWFNAGDASYYSDNSGAMQTGWVQTGENWYLLASSGERLTGWAKVSGKWYYFTPVTGEMKTGFYEVNDQTYYSNASGAMKTGWVKADNKWYYFKNSGVMVKNAWVGGKYWLGDNGVMATNAWVDDDQYFVDANGIWVPGAKKPVDEAKDTTNTGDADSSE